MDSNDPDKTEDESGEEDQGDELRDDEIANYELPPIDEDDDDDEEWDWDSEDEENAEAYFLGQEEETIPLEIFRLLIPFLSTRDLAHCAQIRWNLRGEAGSTLIRLFYGARSPELDAISNPTKKEYKGSHLFPDGMVDNDLDLGTGVEDNEQIAIPGNNTGTISLAANCHILILGDNDGEITVGPDSNVTIIGSNTGRVEVGERSLVYIHQDHTGNIRAEGGSKDFVVIGGFRMGGVE